MLQLMYQEYALNDHFKDIEENKGLILMQFTGLLDKNGKEIYESDIHKLAEGIIAVTDIKKLPLLKGAPKAIRIT